MALTKFAKAPDDRLVYRSSGNVVRGTVTYSTSREFAKRGYTVVNDKYVYYNGRLQGYIGQPNKGQAARINQRARTRAKRNKNDPRAIAEKKSREEMQAMKDAIAYGGYDATPRGGWDSAALGKRALGNFQTGINSYFDEGHKLFVSYQETRQLNFASGLAQAVDANIITIEKANQMWDQYINADSDDIRSKLWDELNTNFSELGYEIESPPLMDEMGRQLGIDITDYTYY